MTVRVACASHVRCVRGIVDVGGVLAVWTGLLGLESFVVALGWRREFVGTWEMSHARTMLGPVALASLVPVAVLFVVLGKLVAKGKARLLATLAFVLGTLVGFGVSTGRHMTGLLVRVPFVIAVGAMAYVAVRTLVKRLPRNRPATVAGLGTLATILGWLADSFVLPRLYPAFHLALFAITLAASASIWLFFRGSKLSWVLAAFGLGAGLLAIVTARRGAKGIAPDDNLRRVLVEHAPLLGRAVVVAGAIAPPPPVDDDAASDVTSTFETVGGARAQRTLDWTGKDIVLLTIDALRADHLSSYGYARTTSPNVDRLAARGARFTHAYCPTPHTSYSIASMMTGTYMRPLLAMGAGADSETWADYLRHYGYRTAAFYPPAVFFIDTHRFEKIRDRSLGFEYKKEEFAKPEVRRTQIANYLATANADKPLFLWVHLFEPHEPYEMHPEHAFSGNDAVDAYDSEIATADALIGEIIDLVEKRRPGATIIFSADHGEEFGDHGGHYHGTSVYEEQVRVPLVIAGHGIEPRVIDTPVQTIDLLPTTLVALDVPMPARVRGRDLGPLLVSKAPADEQGFAFAETDDYTLVARGKDRLVCARKISACTLFDIENDPGEVHAVMDRPTRVEELRRLTARAERDNGKVEASQMPEALRRGMQGDREAAEDVAPLLDDARVDIRRAAAECAFRLRALEMAPQLRRAFAKDEDDEVKKWSAVALVRLGPEGAGSEATKVKTLATTLLGDTPRFRTAAALALAEQGDARGEDALVARWQIAFAPGSKEHGELDEGRELLSAFAKLRTHAAVIPLTRSLEDVRLRPYIVDALADIGDARAKDPILFVFTSERYVNMRPREARALVRLGAREELRRPLVRFAGTPTPMPEAIAIARDGALLDPAHGGFVGDAHKTSVDVRLQLSANGPARLLVLTGDADEDATRAGEPVIRIHGHAMSAKLTDGTWIVELTDDPGSSVDLHLERPAGILAAWIVRRADEIPAPPPLAWRVDAGASEDSDSDGGL
ncbi:MAG: sulfatase-like hydrolase/transferase [Polyangiaceae bacterium]|nr:sulfatase-like hydrolase/transferase [Polyangiaceae bacterium]